jgi:CHAT domain-containing protein
MVRGLLRSLSSEDVPFVMRSPVLAVLLAVLSATAACSPGLQGRTGRPPATPVATATTVEPLFEALATKGRAADFNGVRDIADQIIGIARKSEGLDSLIEARALYHYAFVALLQHDFAATDRAARQAVEIYSKHWQLRRLPETDIPFFVDTVGILADSMFFQRRFNEAAGFREVLVKYFDPIRGPERWRLLSTLIKLSVDLKLAHQYDEGNKQFARAIDEWRGLRSEQVQIPQEVLQNFGSELLRLGDVITAYDVFDRAVRVDQESPGPDTADKGRRLVLLGQVLRERADFSPAIDTLQRGAGVLTRTLGEQHPETISARFQEGKTFLMATSLFANNPTGARSIASTARTILFNVAQSYFALPEDKRTGFGFNRIEIGVSLATAEALAGNEEAAHDLARRILSTVEDDTWFNRPISYFNGELARDFLSLALLFLKEDEFSRAEQVAKFVERGLETLGPDQLLLPRALLFEGLARKGQGDESEGLRLVLSAIDVADRTVDRLLAGLSGRQRLDALSLLDHVDLIFNVPAESVDTKVAYRVALSRKNAIFRFAIDERPPSDTDLRVAGLYRDYSASRRELARMSRTPNPNDGSTRDAIEALSRRTEALERELSQSSDQFRRARAAARVSSGAVCAALGSSTALIEYVAFGRVNPRQAEYVAFVLRGDHCDRDPLRFDLGPVARVSDAVNELRLALKAGTRMLPPVSSVEDSAQHLAALILPAALRQAVHGVPRLAIAPDLDLATIPFALLPGDDGHEFLVEMHTMLYVPSGRDLLRNEHAFALHDRAPTLFAVGNPDFGTASASNSTCVMLYDPLPGSELEVQAVAARLKAEHSASVELIGMNASKERVLSEMGGKKILHFATHAFVGREPCRSRHEGEESTLDAGLTAPLTNSALALRGANGGTADGLLTALEIATLNLHDADLVVLSGCETGLGAINPGQELVGLRWAFMEAGAKSVVTSLWEIPDAPTVAIMANFYDQLIKGGYRPATALRAAQLARLRDDRSQGRYRPWEWGTFTISVSYPEPE